MRNGSGAPAMLIHLLTFASGFANEATAVFWVHHAERGHAGRTGLCGAIQAVSLVFGVGESVHDWRYAPVFVLGYGLGAAVAVRLKARAPDPHP
jgi:hypothetical protein